MKSASGGSVHLLGAESINHDVSLLSCRMADLSSGRGSGSGKNAVGLGNSLISTAMNANPPMLSSSLSSSQSSFVSGLRSIAPSSSSSVASPSQSADDLRADFSRLLGKVAELDRLVLKLTEPPSSDGGGTGRTRKMQGTDLISLPMHLQMLDRLMDLFHQSKRVTVISNNGDVSCSSRSISSDNNSNTTKANSESDGDSSGKNKGSDHDNIAEELQSIIEKKDALLVVAQASLESAKEEVIATKKQLSSSLSTNRLLEDRASVNETEKGQILAEIARMNERLAIEMKEFEEKTRRDTELRILELEDRHKMDLKSMQLKLDEYIDKLNSIEKEQERREGELQTYQLERTLLNRDFATLSNQLHAQKTAYQTLESENVTTQRKLLQLSSSSDEAAISNARIEDLQETIMSLQSELLKNSRRMMTYDKLPDRIAELDMKLSEATKQLVHVTSERDQVTVDLETYKKLSESLKNKIKENWGKAAKGGGSGGNVGGEGSGGREFMDSFEEVMQEEMMAMKVAFETKLKIAKEEAENMSRKHQLEIRNIQNR